MAEVRNGLPPAALERVRELVAPAGRVVRVRPMRGGISSSVHRLPGRPQLNPRHISDYLEQTAQLLARLHRLPIAEFEFLPDQRVNIDRSLSSFQGPENDSLQKAVWAEARAAWPAVEQTSTLRVLVHGDFWPGNMLWWRGRLVGLIDWEQPRLGDPAKDVATCRGDLSFLFGLDAGDEFLERYLKAADVRLEHMRFWDLLVSTWAVPEIEQWAVGYRALGRPDMTPATARDRVRAFASAALAAEHA